MYRRLRITLLLLLLVSLFPVAEPARAASLVVNSLADTNDGACTTDPGGCTLRRLSSFPTVMAYPTQLPSV